MWLTILSATAIGEWHQMVIILNMLPKNGTKSVFLKRNVFLSEVL